MCEREVEKVRERARGALEAVEGRKGREKMM